MSDSNKPDGIIDEKMTQLFGRSWRTSLGGLASGICGVVVVVDQFVPHPVLDIAARICIGLGLAGAGVVGLKAKDKGVSGTAR